MFRAENITYHSEGFTLQAHFTLQAGRKTALTGPSGGGKSTLLALIEGALPLTSGQFYWQDEPLSGLAPAQRPVASLFQNHALFAHLTLEDNIRLAGKMSDMELDELARSVGIEALLSRRPQEVSGGQAQRAAIARLIWQNKPISLLDEPFAALGPRLRRELLALVTNRVLDPMRLIVMVTHHPEEIRTWADDVIFVENGNASAPMSTDAFFASEAPAIRNYL